MTIGQASAVRPPAVVFVAGASFVSAISYIALLRVHGVRQTSIEDDFIREAIILVLLAAILVCFVLRCHAWARHLTAGLATLAGLYLAMSMRLDSSAPGSWLPALPLLALTLLLYAPSSSSWFQAGTQLRDGRQLSSRSLAIAWGIFLVALCLTQSSYWATFIMQGHAVRAARQGNPLFGLVAAGTGFYLFCVHLSYARPDDKGISVHSVATEVALSSLTFLMSLIFPAKSLGYIVLLTGPIQLLAGFVVWAVTVARSWPLITSRRGYLAAYLLGLVAIAWPMIFVVLIARHGIH